MKLSTGREIDCNRDIVGIDEELNLYEGYDGMFASEYNHNDDGDHLELHETLTGAELVEVAEIMLVRWNKFWDKANQIRIVDWNSES